MVPDFEIQLNRTIGWYIEINPNRNDCIIGRVNPSPTLEGKNEKLVLNIGKF